MLKVHSCCHKWKDFLLFLGWITFHCAHKPQFLLLFICQWRFNYCLSWVWSGPGPHVLAWTYLWVSDHIVSPFQHKQWLILGWGKWLTLWLLALSHVGKGLCSVDSSGKRLLWAVYGPSGDHLYKEEWSLCGVLWLYSQKPVAHEDSIKWFFLCCCQDFCHWKDYVPLDFRDWTQCPDPYEKQSQMLHSMLFKGSKDTTALGNTCKIDVRDSGFDWVLQLINIMKG